MHLHHGQLGIYTMHNIPFFEPTVASSNKLVSTSFLSATELNMDGKQCAESSAAWNAVERSQPSGVPEICQKVLNDRGGDDIANVFCVTTS